jgi:DNA-binding response OmpR family regulator
MDGSHAGFADEVARLRGSGVIGHSGRLRDLFDFLAARGPEGEPATQADIAETVFGQPQTEVDDATARVYIHRLRKRLEPAGVRIRTLRGLGYLLEHDAPA